MGSDSESCFVSVIVPFHNSEQFLRQCLTSLSQQTYKNIEIILVDDGSTDGSHKIAMDFATKDDRFLIIKKHNYGQSSARNVGMAFIKNSAFRQRLDSARDGFVGWIDLPSVQAQEKPVPHSPLPPHSKPMNIKQVMRGDHSVPKRTFKQRIEVVANNVIKLHEKYIHFNTNELPPNQFVRFVDSDDYLAVNAIKNCVQQLKIEEDIELVWDGMEHVYHDIVDLQFDSQWVMQAVCCAVGGRVARGKDIINVNLIPWVVHGIFSTSILARTNTSFVDGMECEDHIFGFEVLSNAKKIAMTKKLGYVYRIRPDSTCGYGGKRKKIQNPPYLQDLERHFGSKVKAKKYYHAYCLSVATRHIYDNRHLFYDINIMMCFITSYARHTLVYKRFSSDPLHGKQIIDEFLWKALKGNSFRQYVEVRYWQVWKCIRMTKRVIACVTMIKPAIRAMRIIKNLQKG